MMLQQGYFSQLHALDLVQQFREGSSSKIVHKAGGHSDVVYEVQC